MFPNRRGVPIFIILAVTLSLWGAAWAQTRTEFFSRDLSFSFKDTDRFSVAPGHSSPLLHLVGPENFEFTVSKKTSSVKSLTELAEKFPATLPQGRHVLSNRMTTVGAELATAFEIGDSPERADQLQVVVLRDGQEYLFQLKIPTGSTWNTDRALVLLDQVEWRVPARASGPRLEFRSSDKSFTIFTAEDFRVTHNPHAVLSLASLEEVAVVVTKAKAEHTLAQLYEGVPRSLPAGAVCQGRMMLSIGREQAAAFVIDGMFPPQGPPTHQTLLAVVVRDGQEYDFMVHYPVESSTGLEDAHALLSTIIWNFDVVFERCPDPQVEREAPFARSMNKLSPDDNGITMRV